MSLTFTFETNLFKEDGASDLILPRGETDWSSQQANQRVKLHDFKRSTKQAHHVKSAISQPDVCLRIPQDDPSSSAQYETRQNSSSIPRFLDLQSLALYYPRGLRVWATHISHVLESRTQVNGTYHLRCIQSQWTRVAVSESRLAVLCSPHPCPHIPHGLT